MNIKDSLLNSIEKPARYTGGEWGSVYKEINNNITTFAFCFPDVYEIGMSHLGMKILYHLMNEKEYIYCERVFSPWVDMEEKMREEEIPLYSLETKRPINEFDIVGFTLQYELSYTNILNMLDLGEIPLLSSERDLDDPIVCAGGPCAYNPEPLADFIDFFMLGEGEEVILEVIDAYREAREKKLNREEILKYLSKITGVYVPSLYEVKYSEDGLIESFTGISEDVPVKIEKRIIKDLDKSFYPENIIVPYIDIVHNRIMLELFRGCIRGCRFCQAGYIYRPVREKSVKTLINQTKKLIKNSGYEEISLSSLSTSDYKDLEPLTTLLLEETEKKKINLSLPSLRLDNFSIDLMEKAQKVRKSGLTFAPEAGTQRMRDVINKNISEEDLLNAAKIAFEGGWHSVKLYFMIGLPGETDDDVIGIADLANKVKRLYNTMEKEKRRKPLKLNVSVSSFVPKPFTPFQWEPQNEKGELLRKQYLLADILRSKKINFKWHNTGMSYMEAVIARGDRRIGKVLLDVYRKGQTFDSWDDKFKFQNWLNAFEDMKVDPEFYAYRKREYTENLPWDHIDIKVNKDYLIEEAIKSETCLTTENCREKCTGCGATAWEEGVCIE